MTTALARKAPGHTAALRMALAVLAIPLFSVACSGIRISVAETEAAPSAKTAFESIALSDESPILGIDAILARIPGATRASAGRGVRLGLVESSVNLLEKERFPDFARRIGSRTSAHLVAVRAAARRLAPGAVIAPASFLDEADDVARHAREIAADAVTLTFPHPHGFREDSGSQTDASSGRFGDMRLPPLFPARFRPRHYARTLREQEGTIFVSSIGNFGIPSAPGGLAWHVARIPNGVAAVWVGRDGRIHPLSNRCGPDWKTNMCIAVYGALHFSSGAGAPYHEDGTSVEGTSLAAPRLAAGLALLLQWLREVEGRTEIPAEELLHLACDTARLGPNSRDEVGCGILDLDAASQAPSTTGRSHVVTRVEGGEESGNPWLSSEPKVLDDGSVAIVGKDFDTLNLYGEGRPAAGAGMIYDQLVRVSHDGRQGMIAETMTVDEDNRWIEFVIREEARWHDGAPITPEDVIWTAQALMRSGRRELAEFLFRGVDRVKKTGPRSVRFVFERARYKGALSASFVGWMHVLPRHFWKDRDFGRPILEPPLGSGPYRIADVEPGRSVTYEAVPDYWARHLDDLPDPGAKGTIRYTYLADEVSSEDAR